jgi:hypothetical protein
VATVIAMLVKERDRHRRDTVDFVTKLVESGSIERWQVADQVRKVLQWLQDGSNRVITGTDETRRAPLVTDELFVEEPVVESERNGHPVH